VAAINQWGPGDTKLHVPNKAQFDRVNTAAWLTIAVFLLAATYFSPEIWQHGEAREALVVQDIVNHQRWILPLRNSDLPSKPILYHWIAASFAIATGLSDFVIRLPSAIAAMFLLWATYALGASAADRKTGLLAAGILATTFEFWDSGTEARVDMLFSAFVAAALFGWYSWYRSDREIARAGAYLAAALAVLVKGPAGAVLPAVAIVFFLALRHDLGSLFKFFSWPWVIAVLAIDMSWYLAAYQRGGANFWHKQFVYENVDRFFGGGEFTTGKPRFSQATWLITRLFPWSLVLLYALVRWVRSRGSDSFRCFLHAWWLAVFGIFLFATGQRAVYLLPLYPAVALLAGLECAAFLDSQERRGTSSWRFPAWRSAAAVMGLAVLSVALAAPITRIVEEHRSRQEDFVEQVVSKVPATVPLYATRDVPGPVVAVLAYRLNRSIESRPINCNGDSYYVTKKDVRTLCVPRLQAIVSTDDKQSLHLVHISNGSP
jgi:4-amino-4-deoxy-L-arabinose transferase-like glycosyltransferase